MMRVNPDTQSSLLAALSRANLNEQKVLKQLSSGVRIQTPSDDPAGAAALVEVQSQDAATQQFNKNISAMQAQMQAADSALNAVGLALQRAVTLGVQGATGTLSDGDRTAVANELSGIKDQLVQLANSSLQGVFLFSGTATSVTPFVVDATSTSGIRYQGNDQSKQVEVGDNYWIDANVPGSSIFGDGTNGVFKAVSDLITAVQNNSGVDTSNAAVESLMNHVEAARVQYGNAMNQLTSSQGILNNVHIQLQQQVNSLAATDMAEAASNLVTAETSRSALLQVIAKTNGMSLFDYLR
jgi:flagellar hook-associated protein 3 FlgL